MPVADPTVTEIVLKVEELFIQLVCPDKLSETILGIALIVIVPVALIEPQPPVKGIE